VRTLSRSEAALPAVRRPAGGPPSTRTSTPPSLYEPSPTPAAAIASDTSASLPRAAWHARSTASSATWAPSAMSWTTTSRRARAAPTTPGSRWWNGRIALKRCVTVRAPGRTPARPRPRSHPCARARL
jgi:hypothetical protein